jgi:purine nucleoside phosphorylase
MARISVLCGTGMTELAVSAEGADTDSFRSETPWGDVPCTVVDFSGHQFLFIYRHHSPDGSVTPPHSVEHRANVWAAMAFSPDAVVSVWCVGSMDSGFQPGIVGVADDVLDISGTVWTFHDDVAVHVNRTEPFDRTLSAIAASVLSQAQPDAGESAMAQVVAQTSGPQFESRADVEAYHRMGATCANMTIGGESRLMSEKDCRHVGLILSSNWAAGKDPADPNAPVDHHSVEALAADMRDLVWQAMQAIASSI